MTDLKTLLNYIDPATCSYQEWTSVGMALKHEGYSAVDWDEWSARDSRRYHSGECTRKWGTFQEATADIVTGGTIYQMAVAGGYRPDEGIALGWDDEIRHTDDRQVIDPGWIEGTEIHAPAEWHPGREAARYINTLFGVDDVIGYVMQSRYDAERDKYLPANKGIYTKTAGEILEALAKYGDDIGATFGDYDHAAGAWIRFNPLDGEGVRNLNVTEYRYALVESDSLEIEKQNAIIRELELPVAVLMYSGGKSVHAIVRIDAADYKEYQKRVEYLYDVCAKNGLDIDTQNKNPSRLSRLPGCERGNRKQYIIDTNIGKSSFTEWQEYIESVNDNLPDFEDLADVWDDMPELAPPLIDGILRKGHKMLIAGPSKAGKSFLQIELCIAIAEGRPWLGRPCAQGAVLYVNLELDRASCLHRFKDVYTALGIPPKHLRNIDIWNLRGESLPMDKLTPKLIRRASKREYAAIIIDPIYKVITGDENSAEQMAHFCNQFDRICKALGSAAIYCHHHSKGLQGGKKAMDRASGSGVFARDPDAQLDMIELPEDKNIHQFVEDREVCKAMLAFFNEKCRALLDELSDDDRLSVNAMKNVFENSKYYDSLAVSLDDAIDQAKARAKQITAWRIETTLREFPATAPIDMFFRYPVHVPDESGVLRNVKPEAEAAPWEKQKAKRRQKAEKQAEDKYNKFEIAFSNLSLNGPVSVKALADAVGISDKSLRLKLGKGARADAKLCGMYELYQEGEKGPAMIRHRDGAEKECPEGVQRGATGSAK